MQIMLSFSAREKVWKACRSLIAVGRCRMANTMCVSWIIFLAVTAFLGFLTQMQIQLAMMVTRDVFQFDQNSPQDPQRTVIISGYNKGGGNVVGEVLATRPDTFYAYEPLVTMAESYYFQNSTTMCTTILDSCFETTLTERALDRFRNILSCSSTNIAGDEYNQKWDTGGEPWVRYRECLADKEYDKEFCDKFLSFQCKKANVRIIKTERLSIKLIGVLMKEFPDLSVVHMFRDPRGILFANIKSKAIQGLSKPDGVRQYAKSLCSRMKKDLEAGNQLAAMYSKRFKLLLFEDFRLDMVTVIRPLFRFLGIPLATQDKNIVETVELRKSLAKYNRESGDDTPVENDKVQLDFETTLTKLHPFNWRTEINLRTLGILDTVCHVVYEKLGYNTYENERRLRDLKSWPSYGSGGVYPF